MKFLLSVVISSISFITFAQKQASIWYFGELAGLNFNTQPPSPLLDGKVSYGDCEGTSVIADSDGNLLLYTEGERVFNKLHNVILNGANLWGHNSTTQVLIVPQPGNDTLFYLFTLSPQYNAIFSNDSVGAHYSVVNLNANNGLGAVIQKNILLFKKTTEKVAAVHHANGRDIWVVFHEWESSCFRSYLITETGINSVPVISCIGSIHTGGGPSLNSNYNAAGQMKISPDGSLLGLALTTLKRIEVFFLTTTVEG